MVSDMTTPEAITRACVRCGGSLEGFRPHRKICGNCVVPSRSPEARQAQHAKSRKPKSCTRCGADMELGTHKRLCPTCRATPDPRCKKCKQVKPLSKFSRDTSRPSGYFPWCSDCAGEGIAAGKFQNPEDEPNGHICPLCDTVVRGHKNRRFDSATCKDRVKSLKTKFNLEVEQYRALVDATGGRCPICQNRVTQWHVDHDHKTRKVTGVVCSACNIGPLAMTYHNIELIDRLRTYLKFTPAESLGIEALAPEDQNRPSQLHRVWARGGRRGS